MSKISYKVAVLRDGENLILRQPITENEAEEINPLYNSIVLSEHQLDELFSRISDIRNEIQSERTQPPPFGMKYFDSRIIRQPNEKYYERSSRRIRIE